MISGVGKCKKERKNRKVVLQAPTDKKFPLISLLGKKQQSN